MFVLLLGLAYGESPIAQTQKKINDGVVGAQSTQTDKRGTLDAPLIVNTHSIQSDAEATEEAAKDAEQKRANGWNIRLTTVIAICAFLQFCGILGQIFVYWKQTKIMRDTMTAISGQATTMKIQVQDARDSAAADALTTKATLEAISRQADSMKTTADHTQSLALQAAKQSDLSQRQLDLANRPWISIDAVDAISNLEFRADGYVVVIFRYQIRNVGSSVAQHVLPWIEPIINGIDDPAEVRARISEQLKRPVDSVFDHGRLIFPNQAVVDQYPITIPPNKLATALEKSPFKDRDESQIRGIGLEIFICFDYQSTLDSSKHHQTQSMYLISHQGMGLFLPSQKSYTVAGLNLIFKGFGAYAD